MALPIRRSLPSLSEITSPSAGFPKTFRTSLENTQSCPCNIRARGLTTIPGIEATQRPTSNAQRPTLNKCDSELDVESSALSVERLPMQVATQAYIDLPGIKKL